MNSWKATGFEHISLNEDNIYQSRLAYCIILENKYHFLYIFPWSTNAKANISSQC